MVFTFVRTERFDYFAACGYTAYGFAAFASADGCIYDCVSVWIADHVVIRRR